MLLFWPSGSSRTYVFTLDFTSLVTDDIPYCCHPSSWFQVRGKPKSVFAMTLALLLTTLDISCTIFVLNPPFPCRAVTFYSNLKLMFFAVLPWRMLRFNAYECVFLLNVFLSRFQWRRYTFIIRLYACCLASGDSTCGSGCTEIFYTPFVAALLFSSSIEPERGLQADIVFMILATSLGTAGSVPLLLQRLSFVAVGRF